MLKIKDNIELEELEKFGFKKYGNSNYQYWSSDSKIEVLSDMSNKALVIAADTKYVNDKILSKIYDLFQEGFIEKVDDDAEN